MQKANQNWQRTFGLGLTIMIVSLSSLSHATDDDDHEELFNNENWRLKPRIDTQIRASSDRTLNITEYWRPVWQSPDQVVFGTARIMGDNQSNFEGSLGLGARALYDDHIWGSYIYADRRFTSLGSEFWQGTAGVEYITEKWETHTNIYIPTNRRTVHQTGSTEGPIIAGTGVYIRGPSYIIEEAQPGIDTEIGFKIPDFSKYIGDTHAFIGGYHFDGDETENVTGARARFTADLAPFARIGARAQYDDARGTQYFIELTFRFPGIATNPDKPNLWSRLADSPERDVDIVTVDAKQLGNLTPFIDTTTNAPARFIYVDNTTDPNHADGSAEHPYASLSDAITGAQENDTIYIYSGDSTQSGYDEGYVLTTNNITIHGAGAPLTLSSNRYSASTVSWNGDLILREAQTAPVLTNPYGDIITMTGSNQTIRGIQIDGGAGSGIVVTGDAQNITLDQVMITGNGGNGLSLYHTNNHDMSVTMRNSTIAGNYLYGVSTDNAGSGAVTLDMGTDSSYGGNDIFGNITRDIYANNTSGMITASGNYWGSSPLYNMWGPTGGAIYTGTVSNTSFCTACSITTASFPGWVDQVDETTSYDTESRIMTGFAGSRYIAVSAMDSGPSPEWVVNNVSTGNSIMRISAGDQIALRIIPHPSSQYTRFITVSGSGWDQFFGVQTR